MIGGSGGPLSTRGPAPKPSSSLVKRRVIAVERGAIFGQHVRNGVRIDRVFAHGGLCRSRKRQQHARHRRSLSVSLIDPVSAIDGNRRRGDFPRLQGGHHGSGRRQGCDHHGRHERDRRAHRGAVSAGGRPRRVHRPPSGGGRGDCEAPRRQGCVRAGRRDRRGRLDCA